MTKRQTVRKMAKKYGFTFSDMVRKKFKCNSKSWNGSNR